MSMFRLPTPEGCPAKWDKLLLSQTQMSAMLERERLRADRSGAVFSVATFNVSNAAIDQLARSLGRRLRKTDVVGYAAPEVVGVFLPDTPAHGAWTVVDDVLALLTTKTPRPQCDVYVYPDRSLRAKPFSDQRHLGLRNGNGHTNGQRESDSMAYAQALRTHFTQRLPLWKRGLDITGALLGMALCSPVFVAAALAVKLTSRGPIFFHQQRAGLGGRPFTIWKFRTMCDGADRRQHEIMHLNEQDGAAFKVTDDPRVTSVGRILRTTSIDELPQLWNVLRGDMSLVGPRPLPLHEAADCLTWQNRRLDVTPGLTCIWQIHGRSRTTFDEWMRMDLRYAQRRTLLSDMQLVLQTIPAVLRRRGAS